MKIAGRAVAATAVVALLATGCRADRPAETESSAAPSTAAVPDGLPGAAYGGGELPTALPASTGARRYVATTGSDADDGTADRPWRSIQHALDEAQPGAEGVSLGNTYGTPPDHVELSYNEILGFTPTESDGAYGILHYSGTSIALVGNRIHGIGSRTFYEHGVYLRTGSNVLVTNM